MKDEYLSFFRCIGCGGTSIKLENRSGSIFVVAENETDTEEVELSPEALNSLRQFLGQASNLSSPRKTEAQKILNKPRSKR